MKQVLTLALITLGLMVSKVSAEINTTKVEIEKKEINYEVKLQEAINGLEKDLKNTKSDNNMTIALDNTKVGFYYNKGGNPQKAAKYYEEAVKIVENQTKPYSKVKTAYYNNLATVYEAVNKLEGALKYYKKALVIYKDKLPEDHPYIATTSTDIGNVYEKMGNTEKALSYHENALEIRQKSLRPLNHPDSMNSYDKVLELLEKKKDYKNILVYGKQLNMILVSIDENRSKLLEAKLKDFENKLKNEKQLKQ